MESIPWLTIRVCRYTDGLYEVHEALSNERTDCKTWEEVRRAIDRLIDDCEKEQDLVATTNEGGTEK